MTGMFYRRYAHTVCVQITLLHAALDNQSEAVVQAALDKLMATKDRTIVVIAHRVRTDVFIL